MLQDTGLFVDLLCTVLMPFRLLKATTFPSIGKQQQGGMLMMPMDIC